MALLLAFSLGRRRRTSSTTAAAGAAGPDADGHPGGASGSATTGSSGAGGTGTGSGGGTGSGTGAPGSGGVSGEPGTIAFASRRFGAPGVFVVAGDGTGERRLTPAQGEYFRPAWSPDGKRLAFASRRVDNTDIYVVDAQCEADVEADTAVSSAAAEVVVVAAGAAALVRADGAALAHVAGRDPAAVALTEVVPGTAAPDVVAEAPASSAGMSMSRSETSMPGAMASTRTSTPAADRPRPVPSVEVAQLIFSGSAAST